MKVHVTEEDIENGIPQSPAQCPVARALSRATNRRATCGMTMARLFQESDPTRMSDYDIARLPREASRAIREYDMKQTMEPFEFEISWD